MAVNQSSRIRMSGMNSGFDTESIVNAMTLATKNKIDSKKKQIQKLEWKQEKYRDIIGKLTDLQTNFFDTLKPASNLRGTKVFNSYTVTSSDIKGLKVSTVGSKTASDYNVKVEQLATFHTIEGNEIGKDFSLDFAGASNTSKVDGEYTVSMTVGSVTRDVSFSGTTAEELADSFNAAVLDKFGKAGDEAFAVADASGKITVNGNQSVLITEKDGDFGLSEKVSTQALSFSSVVAGTNTFAIKKGGETHRISFEAFGSDYFKNMSTDEALTNEYNALKQQSYDKAKADALANGDEFDTELADYSFTTSDAVQMKNKAVFKEAIADIDGLNFDEDESSLYFDNLEEFSMNSIDGGTLGLYKGYDNNVTGTGAKLIDLGLIPSEKDGKAYYSFGINGINFEFAGSATINDLMTAVNKSNAGVKISYSEISDSLTMVATDGGNADNIDIESDTAGIFDKLGINGGKETLGQNAIFTINGEKVYHNSNSYTLDGTTFDFSSEIELNKDLKVTTARDTTSTKETIMKFVEDYNKLIDDIYGELEQKTVGYEPLSDDERESLSETQQEKWEENAKKGLLYNDSSIRSVMTSLRSALYNTVEMEDGTTFGIYQMGITTSSDWTSNGKLIVDEAKLDEALKNDIESVEKLFTYVPKTTTEKQNGIMNAFNTALTSAVKSTGIREDKGSLVQIAGLATGSSVIDNRIYDEITSLNKMVTQLTTKYNNQQEYYWSKYTALETQMSELNSQTSQLSSLFNF